MCLLTADESSFLVITKWVSYVLFFCDCCWYFCIYNFSFRFWGHVCRSLLFFCQINSGKLARKHWLCCTRMLHLSFCSLVVLLLFFWLLNSDLFNSFHLQLTFVFLVLPCLLLGYLGQAAYLMENHAGDVAEQAFFSSVPSRLRATSHQ